MLKGAITNSQLLFPGVTKRGVSQIMPKSDRLGQILVQAQATGNCSGNLGEFQGVAQPRPVVGSFRRNPNLSLIFQPTKRLRMNNPVTIDLKRGSQITWVSFRPTPLGKAALGRKGSKDFQFPLLRN
jgi:hypothetical protein